MIYELRTYTIVPGKMPEYLRLQSDYARPIRGDRYGKLEGSWFSEFGTLNQYVHLWSYADAGERQRMRAELAQNKDWASEYLSRTSGFVVAQENTILTPVEGVPFTAPSGGGHIYELRTYGTHYQKAPEWLRNFREALPARQEYSKLVCVWSADVGQLNRVVHLWVYDDLSQRAKVRASVMQDPRWQEYLGKATPLLASQHSVILNPTPSSPIQ